MTDVDLEWMPAGSWAAAQAQRQLSAVIAELPEAVLPYVADACREVVIRYVNDSRFDAEQHRALMKLGRAVDEVFGRPHGRSLP